MDVLQAHLEELGRRVARQIAGDDAVQEVEVAPGFDIDGRPVYRFTYLIDRDRSRERMGLVLSRIIQKLGDELIDRGDEHLPSVTILDQTDWPRRKRA
jgi:hypothetical protein